MLGKKNIPEVYGEQDFYAMQAHISTCFGEVGIVYHEKASPDIHVDICIIKPAHRRNFYTLVTMGMGAHRMAVPEPLRNGDYDRAELLITLPPGWNVESGDEKWYWPLRLLKNLARLPVTHKTWLGHSHTVHNGGPFAENTKLCGAMITMPYNFGSESGACELPGGGRVNFYQVVPLHEDEMEYKIENGIEAIEALESLFHGNFGMVVDVARKAWQAAKAFESDSEFGCDYVRGRQYENCINKT